MSLAPHLLCTWANLTLPLLTIVIWCLNIMCHFCLSQSSFTFACFHVKRCFILNTTIVKIRAFFAVRNAFKIKIKYHEENGPIILWGSCWKFLCGEHCRMVVPQLVHSIKRTLWWRTMTAIQKMLLFMITNITRFWSQKADQKIKPYLNRNLRPIILLISLLKKVPPLFIVSKIFQLSINN